MPSNKISGSGHKQKHRKFHVNNLYCESVRALEQAAGCGFSFSRDIQNLPEQNPVQPAVGEPALAQRLEVVDLQIISPFLSQPFCVFFSKIYSKTGRTEGCKYANITLPINILEG